MTSKPKTSAVPDVPDATIGESNPNPVGPIINTPERFNDEVRRIATRWDDEAADAVERHLEDTTAANKTIAKAAVEKKRLARQIGNDVLEAFAELRRNQEG